MPIGPSAEQAIGAGAAPKRHHLWMVGNLANGPMAVRRHVLWLVIAMSLVVASCRTTDGGDSGTALKPGADAPTSTVTTADPGVEQPPVDKPDPCQESSPDPEQDLAREPSYSADYLHRWTNRRGCPVRLDVLMTRLVRDGACGPDDDIVMGTPLGASHQSESPARIYGETEGAIDRDAQLSRSAEATGYRQGGYELWMDGSDQSSLFLVYADHVERWELAAPPLRGCA